MLAIEFICEQPSTISTNKHSIKIWFSGLVQSEILPPDNASKCGNFTGTVMSLHPILVDTVTHATVKKKAHSSICAWCVPSSYWWYSYLGDTQVTSPVGNCSYQGGKTVLLQDISIFVIIRYSLDLHKVPYLPQSYATPAHKAWFALASGGFKQAEPHSSPSWRQITVITWHLKNATRNMLQKTCRQLLYVVQP